MTLPPAPTGLHGHRNAFGALRLLLAFLVIVQHTLALSGHADLVNLSVGGQPVDWGMVGVAGFFGLSGYLLVGSVTRHSPSGYLRRRAARLLPAFWVTLLAVAFVFAPATAWLSGEDGYVLTGDQSAVSYLTNNALLVIRQHSIGTVAAGNPYPDSLNGSLWSLSLEFTCYLALLVAAVAGRRHQQSLTWLLTAGVGLLVAVSIADVTSVMVVPSVVSVVAPFVLAFTVGAVIRQWELLSEPSWWQAAALSVAAVAVIVGGWWMPIGPILLTGACIAAGHAVRWEAVTRIGHRTDVSYGVYLYHFPILQLMVAAGWTGLSLGWVLGWLLPVAAVGAGLLGYVSWWSLERPSIAWGARSRSQVPPPPVVIFQEPPAAPARAGGVASREGGSL